MGLIEYIKETKAELKHVSWPTRRQSVIFTIIVVLISIGVAAYLGLFDAIFSFILEKLVL
ncbi:MAG TPA: preprotein translocase subunit SecE [Candidatus Paceibacterota bacterium]